MKKSYKYAVTIDNSTDSADVYWAGFDSTKTNSELFGANSYNDADGNAFTTTITVADHANYAYPIMTSEYWKVVQPVAVKQVGVSAERSFLQCSVSSRGVIASISSMLPKTGAPQGLFL